MVLSDVAAVRFDKCFRQHRSNQPSGLFTRSYTLKQDARLVLDGGMRGAIKIYIAVLAVRGCARVKKKRAALLHVARPK